MASEEDPDLLNSDLLSFAARWERIGLPPERKTEDDTLSRPTSRASSRPSSKSKRRQGASRPTSAASTGSSAWTKIFSNVNTSIKLRSIGGKATSRKSRTSTARAFKAARCEAGDPCRLLEAPSGMLDKGSRVSMILASRPDFLDQVADGLQQNAFLAKSFGPRKSVTLLSMTQESSSPSAIRSQLKEAWGVTAFRRTSALDDMLSPQGRAERRNSRGRPGALKDFKIWCINTFGNIEEAWSALDAKGQGSMAKEDFIAALTARGFPMGDLGSRTVFFFIDSGDSDTISKEDVLAALSKIPDRPVSSPTGNISSANSASGKSRASSFSVHDVYHRKSVAATCHDGNSVANQTRRLMELGFDMVEAQALGLNGPEANVGSQWKKKLAILREKDPIIAQLLEFLYKSFGTLNLAFQHMDINGNGRLSKSEFENCLLHGVRSNSGLLAVDEHLQELYKRADPRETSALSMVEFLNVLEKGDPLLERLTTFFNQQSISQRAVGVTPGDSPKPDQGSRRQRLEKAFRAMGMSTGKAALITPMVFVNLLTQLQYQEWHVRDIFHRLDLDGSGEITINEFTAFLMPFMPVRKPKPAKIEPLGSEERRQKVESGVSAMKSSAKIDKSVARLSISQSLPPSPTPASDLEKLRNSSMLNRDRPDFCSIIRDSLQQMQKDRPHSELRQRGHHHFSSALTESTFLPVCKGLDGFSIERSRDRTEGLARTAHW